MVWRETGRLRQEEEGHAVFHPGIAGKRKGLAKELWAKKSLGLGLPWASWQEERHGGGAVVPAVSGPLTGTS